MVFCLMFGFTVYCKVYGRFRVGAHMDMNWKEQENKQEQMTTTTRPTLNPKPRNPETSKPSQPEMQQTHSQKKDYKTLPPLLKLSERRTPKPPAHLEEFSSPSGV